VNLDYLYDRLRHRAPPTLDFDAMSARYRARNNALVSALRERFPQTESAVLEVVIRASGQTRRRLRRYREFSDVRSGGPGVLYIRQLTHFDDVLDFKMIEIGAAAARAGVTDIEWRLLSVTEALTSAP
jgi:hypothetical protein